MGANENIRQAAKQANVTLWEIALHIGVGEATMTRWMRTPLSGEKLEKIMTAISELAKEEK